MSALTEMLNLYSRAVDDEEFKKDMVESDATNITNTEDYTEQLIIAGIYYGYLVGKNGPDHWSEGSQL